MILITGGMGYIGTHLVIELMKDGESVVILDNLCNSSRSTLERIARVAGRAPAFIEGDVRNRETLDALFKRYPIDAVIHCAGLKAVGESVQQPLTYYDNNVGGTVTLCQAMAAAQVFTLVFSSSATVYDDCAVMPINERCQTGHPSNPYGESKLMAEHVMQSMVDAESRWSVGLLRYFNPIGAHDSGHVGEMPTLTPNNLLPYLLQVASGQRATLAVFGSDYLTPDGTGIRDYVHVMDLAEGHIKALRALRLTRGVHVWNLGTGRGHSVLEVVRAFERVSGIVVPLMFEPRRAGDIAQCWADPSKAYRELGWSAHRTLDCMLTDAWRWQVSYQSSIGAVLMTAIVPPAALAPTGPSLIQLDRSGHANGRHTGFNHPFSS
ncbi:MULTISPECIES: UDP-glucose 4-epimerase GalE [unclassified Pseudomonas]|uniref:UDP-glucose 4-epimerase GalE n=1 Tax=unclassified Pseudomonas TaxID=196821 RepID=UPI0025EC5E1D|nr:MULTISPECIES: UDP-glucose 4-epimerase GalE [unclassified Pseudomonas]